MSDSKIYRCYVYLAGIQVPFISASVSSRYGSMANMNLELNYSPYITHIHEFTKIQLWEQIIDNGNVQEPTLELDGVIVGIVRNKNILGNVSVRLTCLTDGYVWNIRKQYDFYISQLTNDNGRGTDDIPNLRADGLIDNYIGNLLSTNKFDIGCSVASLLTSEHTVEPSKTTSEYNTILSYTYIYNGKKYVKQMVSNNTGETKTINPAYYAHYLNDYKLANKLYGISTSANVKEFFQQDRFMDLMSPNGVNDLIGENTFWTIATTIMQYGFYNIYDIPNPTYIPVDQSKENRDATVSVDSFGSTPNPNVVSQTNNPQFSGLAEYILKPVSILGLPLKCNIIWPNQIISESLFNDLANAPTRILLQKSPIPGDDGQNVLLTTTKVAGPYIANCDGFFKSFTPPVVDQTARLGSVRSDYENEYGMRYTDLHLSYAFEHALLEDASKTKALDATQLALASSRINNFLNYEFAQRFFASRNYSIQVTPDVDVVAGLPVIVMNQNGEHVICFCTGKTKTWDNRGNKSVGLEVGYPRYHYENIDKLGNIVDPTCAELLALQELEILFGSKALVRDGNGVNSKPIPGIDSETLRTVIDQMFDNYNNGTIDYTQYKRSVCTYTNFQNLFGSTVTDKYNMPDSYLTSLYESTATADALSSHVFYINKVKQEGIDNQEIIKSHLEWIKEAQRI